MTYRDDLTSAKEDWVTIFIEAVLARARASGEKVSEAEVLTAIRKRGIEAAAKMFPRPFSYACAQMGIPATIEAVDALSDEKE